MSQGEPIGHYDRVTPEERPPIPRPLRRAVLIEAGHRCAIPTCKHVPVVLAHIDPWASVKEHTFENLIALCPTCHTRYDNGDIDRQSMLVYKRNLGLVSSRYGEAERRLLDRFVQHPDETVAELDRAMEFDFMYLLQDGLLEKVQPQRVSFPGVGEVQIGTFIGGVQVGPQKYALTPEGVDFVGRLREGSQVEDTEPHE